MFARRVVVASLVAASAFVLSACEEGSQHSKLVDQGVNISRSDYEKLCKTYRGEVGNAIDGRTWLESDYDKIYDALERDSFCQPD